MLSFQVSIFKVNHLTFFLEMKLVTHRLTRKIWTRSLPTFRSRMSSRSSMRRKWQTGRLTSRSATTSSVSSSRLHSHSPERNKEELRSSASGEQYLPVSLQIAGDLAFLSVHFLFLFLTFVQLAYMTRLLFI